MHNLFPSAQRFSGENAASKRPDDVQELNEGAYIHFREIVAFQLRKMPVVADNVGGSCRDSTIHEFVVIGVSSDEIETKGRLNTFHIWQRKNCIYHILRKLRVLESPLQYLTVLKEYLAGDTNRVLLRNQCVPNFFIGGFGEHDLQDTVGVETAFMTSRVRETLMDIGHFLQLLLVETELVP